MRHQRFLPVLCGFAVVAFFVLSGTVFAAAKKAGAEEEVCYPEALTDEDRRLEMEVPCAPKDYVYMPLTRVQKNAQKDPESIWSDEEMQDPEGVNVLQKTTKVGATEVTISMYVGFKFCSPSSCPVRVRFRNPGHADVVKDAGILCASKEYYFMRKDLKELLVCSRHLPLD